MRRLWSGMTIVMLLSVLPVPASGAQEEEPSTKAADDVKPYMPPSAWKSVEIGNYYLKRKKYPGALSRFQEAVRTDPYYAPGYLGLGKVYEKIGLKNSALDAYRKYLNNLPSAKQADEAKEVHQAIARLERELKLPHSRGHGPSGPYREGPQHP